MEILGQRRRGGEGAGEGRGVGVQSILKDISGLTLFRRIIIYESKQSAKFPQEGLGRKQVQEIRLPGTAFASLEKNKADLNGRKREEVPGLLSQATRHRPDHSPSHHEDLEGIRQSVREEERPRQTREEGGP